MLTSTAVVRPDEVIESSSDEVDERVTAFSDVRPAEADGED